MSLSINLNSLKEQKITPIFFYEVSIPKAQNIIGFINYLNKFFVYNFLTVYLGNEMVALAD